MPPWSPHVCCRGNNRSCVSEASGAAFDPPRTLGRLDRCGKIAYARVENIGTGLAMKRREFITLLGGAAAVWPLAARAQQPERMPRIGVLSNLTEDDPEARARDAAFVQGLRQLDWIAGRNVQIEYRYAAADPARFRSFAAELAGLGPNV